MTMAMGSDLRLVGDVGGTNVRFALVDIATPRPRLLDPRSFHAGDFATLEDAIDRYLPARSSAGRPDSVVMAVAGPVIEGRAHLTNGLWDMNETALLARGFGAARLINDYEALALALPLLGADDLAAVGEAAPATHGTAVVLGAGTGLGVAALVRDGLNEAVAVTEGGHVAFAPDDDTEMEILRHLSARFGRVSLERLLSGPGLVNLRWALGRIRGAEVEPLQPEEIVALATTRRDPLCIETLERFCALYGAAAGDFALAFGAVGGVFLGGGIGPRILDALRKGGFRARFEAKGRFGAYTARIATQVIIHPYAALLGGARARIADRAISRSQAS